MGSAERGGWCQQASALKPAHQYQPLSICRQLQQNMEQSTCVLQWGERGSSAGHTRLHSTGSAGLPRVGTCQAWPPNKAAADLKGAPPRKESYWSGGGHSPDLG